MALDSVVDGTTHAPDAPVRDAGVSQIDTSGPTHQKSGPNGPDPTGLRGTLEKNLANAAQKAAEQTNATKVRNVSRETENAGTRGADGKFVPKDAATTPDPQAQAASVSEQPDEPPSSWRSETKALWKEIALKFSPEQATLLKDELRKRENDFKNGIMAKDAELKTTKPFYDTMQGMLKQHEHLWKDQGVPAEKAVEHLLSLNANFRRDPAGTIVWLAKSAGLDLSKLASAPNQQGGTTIDPQLGPLYQHINGLTQKLQAIETDRHNQTTTAAASQIQEVIDEKGADGQPKRPHFANDAVFQEIQTISQVLRSQHPDWSPSQITKEAYDRAVLAIPDTRQAYIDQLTGQTKANAEAEQRQRAAQAAAQSVKGGPPNNLSGAADPKDLRGSLERKLNAHYSNGAARL
ncbi:hypothetical protein UFOVP1169_13 [uncultured Caudovirales phage]|uniref:Uncharacterized protein n=1 Tax=uncultured Caudovirales phage TaxID=2100421 RepID=A0A6J5R7Y5_9CAUD|nr:hypothetical protein UFOVP1169_13 [uncultured Caudovirales phage]